MAQAQRVMFQADILKIYIGEIKDHELLTRDQEKMLARRYQQADDDDAADRLVRANLRLVVKIAREYHSSSSQLSLNDLIQQGNMGLVHALNKFDPDKQTKFSYYAAFWIKAYMLKYLMDNHSSVKIGKTQAQRKLFFNLHKTKEKLKSKGLPTTPEQIASYVGVKTAEVIEMEKRMGQKDQSLDEPSRTRDREQMIDSLEAEDESVDDTIARMEMTAMLRNVINTFKNHLTRRELEILEKRIIAREPLTLQNLGDRFGVSRERIRQIEAKIIGKLRIYLQAKMPDFQYYLAG